MASIALISPRKYDGLSFRVKRLEFSPVFTLLLTVALILLLTINYVEKRLHYAR